MAEIKYGYKAIVSQGAQAVLADALNLDLLIKLESFTGEIWNKDCSTLCDNVQVSNNGNITGKLFYSEWEEFSSKPEEQQGYYLTLITSIPEGVEQGDFTFELINGTKGAVDLSDGILIFLINDKSKGLILNVKKGEETKTFNYTFDFDFVPADDEEEVEGTIANATEE